eukprot:tig00000057_g136.t1
MSQARPTCTAARDRARPPARASQSFDVNPRPSVSPPARRWPVRCVLVLLAAFAPAAVAQSGSFGWFANGVEGFIQLKPLSGGDFDGLALFSFNQTATGKEWSFFVYHGFNEALARTAITFVTSNPNAEDFHSQPYFAHGKFSNSTGFLTRASPSAAWELRGKMNIKTSATVGAQTLSFEMSGDTWNRVAGVAESVSFVQMFNKVTCAGPAAAFLWKTGTTTSIAWTGGPVSSNYTNGVFVSSAGDLNTNTGVATWDKGTVRPWTLRASTSSAVSALAISGVNEAVTKKFPGEVENADVITFASTLAASQYMPKACVSTNGTAAVPPASVYLYIRGTTCASITATQRTNLQNAIAALARLRPDQFELGECTGARRKSSRKSRRAILQGAAANSGARFLITFPAGVGAPAATQLQRALQSGTSLAAVAASLGIDPSLISVTPLGTSATPTQGVATGAIVATVPTTPGAAGSISSVPFPILSAGSALSAGFVPLLLALATAAYARYF